jgi:prevent-host-death family protein
VSKEVSIRDLRNQGGRVIQRVLAGELLTVTRSGLPVAELGPVRRRGLDRVTLLERWRKLPPVDPEALRRDLDTALDSSL